MPVDSQYYFFPINFRKRLQMDLVKEFASLLTPPNLI